MYKTLFVGLFIGICLSLRAGGYVITAHIRDVKEGTVFFLKQFNTQRIVNAARLENGELRMKGELSDTPQHLWLCTTLEDEFYYCDLLVDTGSIRIEGSIHDFPNGLHFVGAKTQKGVSMIFPTVFISKEPRHKRNMLPT